MVDLLSKATMASQMVAILPLLLEGTEKGICLKLMESDALSTLRRVQ